MDPIQSFYERYPYPNVQRFSRERMETYAQPLIASAKMKMSDLQGKTILDVGCGTGEIACSLATHAKKVDAIDVSQQSIILAQKRSTEMGLKDVSFHRADLFSFYPKQKYDIVTSFGVFHHTAQPEKAFERMSEWVKPNGIMIVGFYHPWGGWWQRVQKKLARIFGWKTVEQKLQWVENYQHKKMNPHSQAFWADRIANPREKYYRVFEIQKWFEANGMEVIGIQSHKPEWDVSNVNNPFDVIRFELELFIRRKRFVIMAGKKLD